MIAEKNQERGEAHKRSRSISRHRENVFFKHRDILKAKINKNNKELEKIVSILEADWKKGARNG